MLTEPEQPFWGFAEIFLTIGLFLAVGTAVVSIASHYLHAPKVSGLWSVGEEAVVYAIVFLALHLMFARHGHGVLEALGWSKLGPFSPTSLALTGLGLSFSMVVLQKVLLTPDVETSFDKMLADPAGRIAVALLGLTLGPVAEELLFRGLLQPVLVSALGVLPGILLPSILFGAAHLFQNDFIWQSGVLIAVVGFVLGTVRHVSGSTRASTIVHIAYNSLPFLGLIIGGDPAAHR